MRMFMSEIEIEESFFQRMKKGVVKTFRFIGKILYKAVEWMFTSKKFKAQPWQLMILLLWLISVTAVNWQLNAEKSQPASVRGQQMVVGKLTEVLEELKNTTNSCVGDVK